MVAEWWRRRSLRARLTLTATALLAAGLAAGGVLLVGTVRAVSLAALDREAVQAGRDVAALVAAGQVPDPLPVAGERLVQVVDTQGRVVAASPAADRLVPMVPVAEIRAGGPRYADEGRTRVVTVPVGTDTVVVGVGVTDVRENLRLVRNALLAAAPLLLAGVAALCWVIAGRSLRPVEQARRRQRAFVADAAHELRNPLASLRTQLEVAQRGGTVRLDDLFAEAERLSHLVDDLLLLARLDDAGPVRSDPVPVADLVADLAVPVTLAVPDGLRVPGDLRRVLANLVDNAVRHAASRVDVSLTATGGEMVVVVTDDGPGIEVGDRERVFERFTRLDDGRARDGGGAGLGLAIVRDLVRGHGGTVTLADAGPGVRAEVRVPL
ncbi:MAG TPA: HAMP domain-containing sensor histidine kinase [Mycobacteriales bacterium]|jgi:signal transduction histidine kinase